MSELANPNCQGRWTAKMDARLIEMLEDHHGWTEISRAMSKSLSAVHARASALGLNLRNANGYTKAAACRVLGIDHKILRRWARDGLLRVHRSTQRMGRGTFGFVEHDDLIGFLEAEEHWHQWEPDRIADVGLREWAVEMRRGLRFVTCAEAAPLLHMTPLGVQVAIREGRLRGLRRGAVGDRWLIRSDWLRLTERCSCKGRLKPPPFSDAEKEIVRRWWGIIPATAIARMIRPGADSGVHAVARRLGLARLGRGVWKKRGGIVR